MSTRQLATAVSAFIEKSILDSESEREFDAVSRSASSKLEWINGENPVVACQPYDDT